MLQVRAAALAGLAAMGAGQGAAQSGQFDAALAYSARDEVPGPDGEQLDNDLARLTAGYAWSVGDGRMRAALEFGVRNEDFESNPPFIWGTELVYGRRVGNQRYSLGARLRSDEDLSTTTELGYIAQHLGQAYDLRVVLGLQLVGDVDDVAGRSDTSVFGLGEAAFYFSDNWAISGGLLADSDGEVYTVGTEFRPAGASVSLFVDYAEAFDGYRDGDSYDNLTAGIRIVPGTRSLREQRQSGFYRIFQRSVEVQ